MKLKTTKVAIEDIREVAEFEAAKIRLERMKDAYFDVLDQFGGLVEDYNTKLEAASKAVAARGVECGDFTIHTVRKSYNAEKLFDLLGKEGFQKVGGIVETKRVLSIDKKILEASILTNAVPAQVVQEVVSETIAYKKPKQVVMP